VLVNGESAFLPDFGRGRNAGDAGDADQRINLAAGKLVGDQTGSDAARRRANGS